MALQQGTQTQNAEWKTYQNEKYGFSFKYPQELGISRNLETQHSDFATLDVTLDRQTALGGSPFDMQVSDRNPKHLSILNLLKSFGSPRQYDPYGKIAGVDPVISGSWSNGATINFTKGILLFNIDFSDLEPKTARSILDSFVILPIEATPQPAQ